MSSLQNLHDESGRAARLRDVTTLRSTHRSTLVAFPVLECLVLDVNDIDLISDMDIGGQLFFHKVEALPSSTAGPRVDICGFPSLTFKR